MTNSSMMYLRRPLCISLCDRNSNAVALYEMMYTIRAFEHSLLEMFGAGVLAGTTHTCLGQEATAAGILSAIDRKRDCVVTNHRNHGHFLAYCGELERLYLEVMGRPEGICAGRGGSQHLHFHNYYSNGVQGGIVPFAVGIALAEKNKRSGAVTIVFLGDGTLGEGAVYEAFNCASLWGAPVLFVIEDNGYAQSTPRRLGVSGSIRARAEAFDIPVDELHACSLDPCAVLQSASGAIDRARVNVKPQCIVLHNYRLGPHSKGDDQRDASEVKRAWEHDPLAAARARLALEDAWQIEQNVTILIHEAQTRVLDDSIRFPRHGVTYDQPPCSTNSKNGEHPLFAQRGDAPAVK
ncbi:MAG TPA: thiamine pyrophosphate-dependent dehydrogenase E1 component subunit alpha [Bacteroidota bacterium]|nr:thiamine pyrophosphate-dependent dehydrogenase E1 component subunit alpha [Bacteroidota bacterium]